MHLQNAYLNHKDKLVVISDRERSGLHPLCPALISHWYLEKVEFEYPDDYKVQITEKYREEAKPRKKTKKDEESTEDSPSSFTVISADVYDTKDSDNESNKNADTEQNENEVDNRTKNSNRPYLFW